MVAHRQGRLLCFLYSRHVPLWGIGVPELYPAPGYLHALWQHSCRGDALGVGQAAIHPYTDGHAGDLGAGTDLEAGGEAFHCFWSTVEAAVDEAVAYGLAHSDLTGVTHIGIDEIFPSAGMCMTPTSTTSTATGCCMWQPYTDVIKARAPKAAFTNTHAYIRVTNQKRLSSLVSWANTQNNVQTIKKTAGTRPAVTVRVRGRQPHVVEAIC